MLTQLNDPTFEQPLYNLFRGSHKYNGKSADNSCLYATDEDGDGDESAKRPPLDKTTNQIYGRLARRPLEAGGSFKCRHPYARLRQIGSWNDSKDKIILPEDK